MKWLKWWQTGTTQYEVRASRWVIPDNVRCVQCGICSYNCPIGIDVRRYAWLGAPIKDSHCLTCGECLARCPRGVLRFDRSNLTESDRLNLAGV